MKKTKRNCDSDRLPKSRVNPLNSAEHQHGEDESERDYREESHGRQITLSHLNIVGDGIGADQQVNVVIPTSEEAEMKVLGDQLASTYRHLVESYRDMNRIDAAKADVELQKRLVEAFRQIYGTDEYAVRSLPASQVDWFRLVALAEHDAHLMLEVWRAINEVALSEFYAGYRAADVVAEKGETPLERARFLALRASMIFEWQPRGATELTLIDVLVQAHTLYERWMRRFNEASTAQTTYQSSIYSGRHVKEPPRLSDSVAVEAAAAMAERFNRLYLRTLRQLRDLRRYAPSIMIQNADQVNIGGQQINVAKTENSVEGRNKM